MSKNTIQSDSVNLFSEGINIGVQAVCEVYPVTSVDTKCWPIFPENSLSHPRELIFKILP